MWRTHTRSSRSGYTKAVVLHRVLMIIVMMAHRTMLAIMQAELVSWRNSVGHNTSRARRLDRMVRRLRGGHYVDIAVGV